jgi:hypothetical protein
VGGGGEKVTVEPRFFLALAKSGPYSESTFARGGNFFAANNATYGVAGDVR